jgi:hypothetical protein
MTEKEEQENKDQTFSQILREQPFVFETTFQITIFWRKKII